MTTAANPSAVSPAADPGCLDRAFAADWYGQWVQAWNTHDFDGVQQLVSEDFLLDSPTSRQLGWTVQGRDATSDYLHYVLAAYPDLVWEQLSPPLFRDDVRQAAFLWRGTGHFSGVLTPPGIAGNGNPFEFSGVETFSFRGELACRLEVTYDLAGLLKQVGLYRSGDRG